jgi:hypothetical protein
MSLLADECTFVPADTLHIGHDADVRILLFEDRALLDMQLEKRGQLAGAACLAAAVSDLIERVAKAECPPDRFATAPNRARTRRRKRPMPSWPGQSASLPRSSS